SPSLDRTTRCEQLLSRAVKMIDVGQSCVLMRAAVGDGDVVPGGAKMPYSYGTHEPGPTQKHDAHRPILPGTNGDRLTGRCPLSHCALVGRRSPRLSGI